MPAAEQGTTTIASNRAEPEANGAVRLVVSHEDPGVPNWIETAGHHRGTMGLRWVKAASHPAPGTRVVKRAELAQRALDLARRLGDPEALLGALAARGYPALLGPATSRRSPSLWSSGFVGSALVAARAWTASDHLEEG